MTREDFAYLKADSVEAAVEAWRSHAPDGRYLAGGTEIVAGLRRRTHRPAALIDIKAVPETRVVRNEGGMLYLGACLSLNEAAGDGGFPLLAACLAGPADRTVRNRLTLGGNLCGDLPYREASIALLASEAVVHTALPGQRGGVERRERRLREVFDKRLLLEPGELALGFSVSLRATRSAWRYFRRTNGGRIDYPLVASCFVVDGAAWAMAVTGAHPHPLRSEAADELLSAGAAQGAPAAFAVVDEVVSSFGEPSSDHRGSGAYRRRVLSLMTAWALEELL